MRSILYKRHPWACFIIVAVVCPAVALPEEHYRNRRSDDFEVTSPKAGDTFAVSGYSTPARLSVQWTVPDSIADRNIYISLVQGPDVNSLTLIEVVNGECAVNDDSNLKTPLIEG